MKVISSHEFVKSNGVMELAIDTVESIFRFKTNDKSSSEFTTGFDYDLVM